MTLATLPHPRLLPLILAVLFIIFALSSLLFRDYAPILNPIPNTFVRRERTQNPYSLFGRKGNTISIQTVLDAGARFIAESSEHFDTVGAKRDLGIDIGGNWTLQSYADYLENTWHEFLVPQGSNVDHPTLQTVISYTSLLPRQQEIETAIPKLIYTTDLLEPQQLSEQFQSWITQNPDWTAMFVADEQIDTWLEKSLGSQGIKSKAQDELLALKEKWGVVHTASVLPIAQWARNPAVAAIAPLLTAIPQLISIIQDPSQSLFSTISTSEPSLVVAIESDALSTGANWREQSFTRGIQIVQWTIMANRGHPVLLDVIGMALRKCEEIRQMELNNGVVRKEDVNILDWSGPGAFTDAVFRYLLVRYGFHPAQASGLKEPLKVGDVIIMPVHSFRADASEGFQGAHKVVWHGFFGRWKGKTDK
uniref:Alpha-1,6-mannosyltransferase n=1 Tax=Cryptococcus bacillisporus CA1280 TaxID=1296109 RepID=A0A0D0UNT6_CRYGA|nr:alpha-1,6-mannosyltransferase [Cryptococcus bacillisporus CA1280]